MKEGQIFKLKESQQELGLPTEVTIEKIDGDRVDISSDQGKWESTREIVESLYEPKEELTTETLPKFAIAALDEVIALFDMYAATQSPLAGLNVKTKILNLKDSIAKVSGMEVKSPLSILGKKLS